MSWDNNSSIIFKLIHFFSYKRISLKSQLWDFQKLIKLPLSFSKPGVSYSSNFTSILSVMKDTLLHFFRSKIKYFGLKKNPLKYTFLRLSSARVKIHQRNNKSISLKIFHHISVSLCITPLYTFRSYIFYFGQKDLIKVAIFTFVSALVKISKFISCHFRSRIAVVKTQSWIEF